MTSEKPGRTISLMVTPAAKREAVAHLCSAFDMSERRACRTIELCADDGAVLFAAAKR